MLHFLMSNPIDADDTAFVAMMKDFVERHRNGAASTEDFWAVASEHFARTPIAQKFGLRDLDWFFRQWVYGTELPSYTLEYQLKPQPDGGMVVSGLVKQDNVGDGLADGAAGGLQLRRQSGSADDGARGRARARRSSSSCRRGRGRSSSIRQAGCCRRRR